ncbi:MAG: helical backbone metal receptor [Bacteroidota bacterium]
MPKTITRTDQMHRSIAIPDPPQRIISLVPSQTELLFYLGLTQEVVGITKFCIHPVEQFRAKTKIGGTKQFHFDRIAALHPDLLIGNKEENEKGQIEQLAAQYPLWMSDIVHLGDAMDMILQIGTIVNRQEKATELVAAIEHAFTDLKKQIQQDKSQKRVAYLIWRKPYMVAANGTFIHEMLQQAGFINAFADQSRYPEVTVATLRAVQPDCLFLSSEPFPFKDKHLAELQNICPNATIKLVDGTLFSWYGNRLLHSAAYFLNLRKELYTQ